MSTLPTQNYIALFMAILVYGSGSGSKCPHDLFADLKGWYLESLNKLQASSSTADDKQIGKKFAAPLGCITLMNRRTVSSKADILEGADEACRQLPNGRIYGDVDVAGLKVEGSRILIGIKIVKLESKSSTTNNILTGAAVVYPDMREITFSFERKDSGEINEVGVVLRIKRSMVETLFNNPSTPVCIIRVEESTEITSCTLFNSYTSMLCQSSALLNCSRGADTFDKGCTCKEGFTGALCLEREKIEVPWYQNQTILEYIGLVAAGLFLLGAILLTYFRLRRRRRHTSSAYSEYSRGSPTTGYSRTRGRTTETTRKGAPSSTAPPSCSKKQPKTTAYDTDTGATLKQFPTIVPGAKLVTDKSKKAGPRK